MSTVSTKTTDVDNITPDDSASNVSGTTHTSTRYVLEAQQHAAAEAKIQLLAEQHQLEMTIANIEDENNLAEQQKRNHNRHRRHELAERELETERAACARRRPLKQAEMSMLEFKARTAAITGSNDRQQSAESQVSRATTCKSLTSGSYKDAKQQQNHDSLNDIMETFKDCNTNPSETDPRTVKLGVCKLNAERDTISNAATRPSFVTQ